MRKSDASLPLNEGRQELRLLSGGAVTGDQPTGQYDGAEKGLEHEPRSDLFHDDHDFGSSSETAVLLGKADAQHAELREAPPCGLAESMGRCKNRLASREVVLARNELPHRLAERLLFRTELEVHGGYRPSKRCAMMLRWISLDPP